MTEYLRTPAPDASEIQQNRKTRGGVSLLGSVFLMEGSSTGLGETGKRASLAGAVRACNVA